MSFREPSNYSQSLNKLYLMFNNALDEMRKNYSSYKLENSPEYTGNLNTLNNVKAEIFREQQSLFSSTEKIKKEVDLNEHSLAIHYDYDIVPLPDDIINEANRKDK